jgi:hypothetical protein
MNSKKLAKAAALKQSFSLTDAQAQLRQQLSREGMRDILSTALLGAGVAGSLRGGQGLLNMLTRNNKPLRTRSGVSPMQVPVPSDEDDEKEAKDLQQIKSVKPGKGVNSLRDRDVDRRRYGHDLLRQRLGIEGRPTPSTYQGTNRKLAFELAPVAPPVSATGFTPGQTAVNNLFNQPAPSGQPLAGTAGQPASPGAEFEPDMSRRQQARNLSQYRQGITPLAQRSSGYLPQGQRPLPSARSYGAQFNPKRNQQAQSRADVMGNHQSSGSTPSTRFQNRMTNQRARFGSPGDFNKEGFASVPDSVTKKDSLWWYMPSMLAAGLGGGYGGWKVVDKIMDKRRQGEVQDELEAAQADYRAALESHLKVGSDSEIGNALDALYAKMEKASFSLMPSANTKGTVGGMYASYAIPSALLGYLVVKNLTDKGSKRKTLQKAQQNRASKRQASRPAELYAVPAPVDDSDED